VAGDWGSFVVGDCGCFMVRDWGRFTWSEIEVGLRWWSANRVGFDWVWGIWDMYSVEGSNGLVLIKGLNI
jgi:hypothetical protein